MPEIPSKRLHSTVSGKHMAGSAAVLLFVVLCGVGSYDKKYVPVRLPNHTMAYKPRTSIPVAGQNSTPPELIRCSVTADASPCYPGIGFIGSPLGISILNVVVPFGVTIGGALYFKVGNSFKRIGVYVLGFVIFKLAYELKKMMQGQMDFSDHVTLILYIYAVVTREHAFHICTVEEGSRNKVYQLLVALTIGVQLYEVYFTARYFHTPVESMMGFVLGLLFMALLWLATTPNEYLAKCNPNHPRDDEGASAPEWSFSTLGTPAGREAASPLLEGQSP
jgi:hypothetical protein